MKWFVMGAILQAIVVPLATADSEDINIIEFVLYQDDQEVYRLGLDDAGALSVAFEDGGMSKGQYQARVDPVVFYSLKESLLNSKECVNTHSNWSSITGLFLLYTFEEVQAEIVLGHLSSEQIRLYLNVISLLHGSAVVEVVSFPITSEPLAETESRFLDQISEIWLTILIVSGLIVIFLYLKRLEKRIVSIDGTR